jgi:chromosome segregation ATPase
MTDQWNEKWKDEINKLLEVTSSLENYLPSKGRQIDESIEKAKAILSEIEEAKVLATGKLEDVEVKRVESTSQVNELQNQLSKSKKSIDLLIKYRNQISESGIDQLLKELDEKKNELAKRVKQNEAFDKKLTEEEKQILKKIDDLNNHALKIQSIQESSEKAFEKTEKERISFENKLTHFDSFISKESSKLNVAISGVKKDIKYFESVKGDLADIKDMQLEAITLKSKSGELVEFMDEFKSRVDMEKEKISDHQEIVENKASETLKKIDLCQDRLNVSLSEIEKLQTEVSQAEDSYFKITKILEASQSQGDTLKNKVEQINQDIVSVSNDVHSKMDRIECELVYQSEKKDKISRDLDSIVVNTQSMIKDQVTARVEQAGKDIDQLQEQFKQRSNIVFKEHDDLSSKILSLEGVHKECLQHISNTSDISRQLEDENRKCEGLGQIFYTNLEKFFDGRLSRQDKRITNLTNDVNTSLENLDKQVESRRVKDYTLYALILVCIIFNILNWLM